MWFRRDLRCSDNAALHQALQDCGEVYCAFVFDSVILEGLPREDRRVEFIRESLVQLDDALRALSGRAGAGVIVRHAVAENEIPRLAHELGVHAVYANHDYEPLAIARDAAVRSALARGRVAFHTSKDHVIFERDELQTQGGKPYVVFTPYRTAWLKKVDAFYLKPHPVEKHAQALAERPAGLRKSVPALRDIGFATTNLASLGIRAGENGARALFNNFRSRMERYHETRDFPAIKGPSYLSVHLRFGTISLRQLAAAAQQASLRGSAGARVWLSELIWRDFYFQILANFPHVVTHSFKPAYDAIEWERDGHAQTLFRAWCEGCTGYPIVDAAMRQINQTGYMHNRLRMITASFLCKDLGVDWRWGERYFAEKLNDFDLAANNGGWQWASSSGCDAQPYFRIFSPLRQSLRFDAGGQFIRKYLPQLAALPTAAQHDPGSARPVDLAAAGVVLGTDYPRPLVDHGLARAKTLQRYAAVKEKLSDR